MDETLKMARRRSAEQKTKAQARQRLATLIHETNGVKLETNVERVVGKMAHTKTRCSCPLCGNPRRYSKGSYRQTLVERKQRLKSPE